MQKPLLITVCCCCCLLGFVFAGSPRLPRTSADQRSTRNVSSGIPNNVTGNSIASNSRSSQRNREQYLFNVFEVIVSTLESKLQRIENLDKAVEHLMRRVEALDSRVTDNIDKTDAVITKLRTLDLKLFSGHGILPSETIDTTRVTAGNDEEGRRGTVGSGAGADGRRDGEEEAGVAAGRIRLIQPDLVGAAGELSGSLPATVDVPAESLGEKLLSLDQKVSDIDNKLVDLKNQLDSNFLQSDDINAEASEKKPVSMSVIEITKAMSNEVMNHVTIEIENLRQATGNMDRKLQFHMNIVSENLGSVYNMMTDVHEAIVGGSRNSNSNSNSDLSANGSGNANGNGNGKGNLHLDGRDGSKEKFNSTRGTIDRVALKQNKIDQLVENIYPMLTVSEKMDQVWNIVVGTKSSVDDLLPKSDELLSQTQRQERAINEIHADLKSKANKIIENLEGVESRLRKQETDVVTLAQRPIPAELLLDPTIDRLVEYDPNRYDEFKSEEFSTEPSVSSSSGWSGSAAGIPTGSSSVSISSSSSMSPAPATISAGSGTVSLTAGPTSTSAVTATVTSTTAAFSSNSSNLPSLASTTPSTLTSSNSQRTANKNRGVIFPSVKNKPSPANSTFTTDLFLNYKDVKGYSCVDLLNAGMRDSGVYYLQIRGTTYWFLKVYCEQDVADGGWTVIQRRDDFGEPRENFNRDWADYKNGFGDPGREFWLGNENIYMLTNNEDYMLRVELEDFEGNKRYAQYSHFKIYSEAEYYKLEIDGYDGNAGDSLNDPWYGSNNSPFSTYNRDNDRSSLNCASMLKGGWWWKSCGRGLNGLYLNDPQDLTARQGIVWFRWRGWDYTLKRATMMIKPKGLSSTPAGTAA